MSEEKKSPDELAGTDSPIGKKLVAETEPLVTQVRQNASVWHQKLSTDMVSMVREEMKKRGFPLEWREPHPTRRPG